MSAGRKKALRRSEVGELPACPFDAKARPDDHAAWLELVEHLDAGGLASAYAQSDAVVVERAAVLLARARRWSREAAEVIAADGWYVETRANGLMPHPALREERNAWEVLAKALTVLGMDPRSRQDLATDDGGVDALDELERKRRERSA